MISFLEGQVIDIDEGEITLLNSFGIGFLVRVASRVIENVSLSDTSSLFIYTNVKEDEISLYGFSSKNELKLFKMLISVSGLGPKGALNILSLYTYSEIVTYILLGDTSSLSKANGVGKKTCEKIIIELKDKLDMESILLDETKLTQEKVVKNEKEDEAIEALTALGYNKNDSKKAISMSEISENDSIEEIIKKALLNI